LLSVNCYIWLTLVTSDSLLDAVRNCVFLAVVSAIYYWRARTEETHLLAEDPRYVEYHAWMAENGVITSRLVRLTRALNPRRTDPIAEPADKASAA
jgi:hypothetical protein